MPMGSEGGICHLTKGDYPSEWQLEKPAVKIMR